jgi:hypothetical protein
MKLKIHSVVDLITNSSTVIFTYSEGSLPALEELVNEMLKTFGRTEKFNDVFYAEVFLEEQYKYMDYILQHNIETDIIDSDGIEKLIHEVLIGNIEKPQWMLNAEDAENDYCYRHDTLLEIIPKEEKYKDLADLLLRYLYSTNHEATRD